MIDTSKMVHLQYYKEDAEKQVFYIGNLTQKINNVMTKGIMIIQLPNFPYNLCIQSRSYDHYPSIFSILTSFFFAEVIKHIRLRLELPCIGIIVPQSDIKLLKLLHSQPSLQNLDPLHEVITVVLETVSLVGLPQSLELRDALEPNEVLLGFIKNDPIDLTLRSEAFGVLFISINAGVQCGEDVHMYDGLEVGIVPILEEEVREHPELPVAPLPPPRLHPFTAFPDVWLLLFRLTEDLHRVESTQSEEEVGQVVDSTEVLPLKFSPFLQMLVDQQLQFRILLEIRLPLIDKLKHPEQLSEDYSPNLLKPHHSVKIDVEDVAINGVLLDLVCF